MAAHTVIYGSDLKQYLAKVNDHRAEFIDPTGVNLVGITMLHNDMDIRAELMLKLVGSREPHSALIDFPMGVYKSITQTVMVADDDEQIH